MRELLKRAVMGMALCVAPAALAQDAGTKPAKQDGGTQPAKESPTEQIKREVGGTFQKGVHKVQEIERDVRGTDGSGTSAQKAPSAQELSQAFDLKGTVKSPSAAFLTVERKGLPTASLSVRDRTQVTLDGKQVAVQDLPAGAEVRAKFQLEGEEPVALRIEARSPSATGGSGGVPDDSP
jgi:hypothetical protein